jgi:hypothetical protein
MEEVKVFPPVLTGSIIPNNSIQEETSTPDNSVQRDTLKGNIGRLERPDLKTYSRRDKTDKAIAQSTPNQEQCLNSGPESSEFPLPPDCSSFDPTHDLDVLIALRKGIRSCTKHSISNFVSYNSLSPSYRAFILSVSSISIPRDWREAYQEPKWREAMFEEMKAL